MTTRKSQLVLNKRAWESIVIFLVGVVFWAWFLWIPSEFSCESKEKHMKGTIQYYPSGRNGNWDIRLDGAILKCARSNLGLSGCPRRNGIFSLGATEQATAVYKACKSGFGSQDLTIELQKNGVPLDGYSREQLASYRELSRNRMMKLIYFPLFLTFLAAHSFYLFRSLRAHSLKVE